MSNKQMVINPYYGISKEDIFQEVKNMASNQLFECDIIIPSVSNVNNKPSYFLQEAQKVFPNLLGLDVYGEQKLGTNKYIELARHKSNRIFFCNMFCEKYRKNKRNINYLSFFTCLLNLRETCYQSRKQNDKTIKIHCRKDAFGINNKLGGKWSTISDIMSDCLNGIEVILHV